jgi:hypothetical protein
MTDVSSSRLHPTASPSSGPLYIVTRGVIITMEIGLQRNTSEYPLFLFWPLLTYGHTDYPGFLSFTARCTMYFR